MGAHVAKESGDEKQEENLPEYKIETKSKPATSGQKKEEASQENLTHQKRSHAENRAIVIPGNPSCSRHREVRT